MTSVMSSFSQIPVRAKYLLGIPGITIQTSATVPSSCSGFSLDPGAFLSLSSVTTDADISGGGLSFTPLAVSDISGALFKDMGRQLTIYDPASPTSNHIAVFRQVQRVLGSGSEGVGSSAPVVPETYLANLYVKVWSADGSGVAVVRTG